MKVEIFKAVDLVEDSGTEIRIDTYLPSESFMTLEEMPPLQIKTDNYHINVIAEQRVIDTRYDTEHEIQQLIVKGYNLYQRPKEPPYLKYFELIRKIVIQDPMINAILEKQKIKQDGYLTQNLELQRENRYIDNLLKAECTRSIKTRDKIRKMSFIDRVFRWKKIRKELLEM